MSRVEPPRPTRPGAPGAGGEGPRVLAVTGDLALREQLSALAAAAGVELTIEAATGAADHRAERLRGEWQRAALALVGPDSTGTVPTERRCPVVVAALAPVGESLWSAALTIGAEHVAVLPEAEGWLVGRLVEAVEPSSDPGVVLGVVGGRGGAGASVLAAALAATAARWGVPVLLVDADPSSGGADLVLGAEQAPGLRWPDLAGARGRLLPGLLTGALPVVDGIALLSWDRDRPADVPPDAMRAVLESGSRAMDLVVVDLPRRFSAAARVAASACDRVLLVVPAEVRATAAAARVTATLAGLVADVRLVVRLPAPGGLTAGAVAEALDLPLAGALRPEPGLPAALERGLPPAHQGRGPLATLSRRLLTDLVPATGGRSRS